MVVLLLLSTDHSSLFDLLEVLLPLGLSSSQLVLYLHLEPLSTFLSLGHLGISDLLDLKDMVSQSLLHNLHVGLTFLRGLGDVLLDLQLLML